MPRKILVTGADGFIGSHLTETLVRQGHYSFPRSCVGMHKEKICEKNTHYWWCRLYRQCADR